MYSLFRGSCTCLSFLLGLLVCSALIGEDTTDAEVARQICQMAKADVVFRGSRTAEAVDTDFKSPYILGANALNPLGYAAVPELKKMLTDADPRAVIVAADMLLSIGDSSLFGEAAQALERIRSNLHGEDLGTALYLLIRLTNRLPCDLDPDKVGRDAYVQAMLWLKWHPMADAEKFALAGLESQDRGVRMAGAAFLGEKASPEASAICLKKLANPEGEVLFVLANCFRAAAQHARAEQLQNPVAWALDQSEPSLALPAVNIALDFKIEALLPKIEKAYQFFSQDSHKFASLLILTHIFDKLVSMNSAGSQALLLKLCKDKNDGAREMCISALGKWENAEAVSVLKDATDDEKPFIRAAAIKSLAKLSAKFPEAAKCLEDFAQRKVRDETDDCSILVSYLNAGKIERADAYFQSVKNDDSSQLIMECSADPDLKQNADRKICEFFARTLGTVSNVRIRRGALDNVLQTLCNRPYTALEPLILMHGQTRTWEVDKNLDHPLPERVYDAAKNLPDDEGALIKLLDSPNLVHRIGAVWKLWHSGTKAALPALEKAAKDPSFSDGTFNGLVNLTCLWTNRLPADAYIVRQQAFAALEAVKSRK